MNRYIEVTYYNSCYTFKDLETGAPLGTHSVKIGESWLLSEVVMEGGEYNFSSILAVCYIGNADKTKCPVMLYHANDFKPHKKILMLSTSTTSFNVRLISTAMYDVIKMRNVSTLVKVEPDEEITIVHQYIDDECTNPILAVSKYNPGEECALENGFEEIYHTLTKYTPYGESSETLPRYILQKNGKGDTTTLYYDVMPISGLAKLLHTDI